MFTILFLFGMLVEIVGYSTETPHRFGLFHRCRRWSRCSPFPCGIASLQPKGPMEICFGISEVMGGSPSHHRLTDAKSWSSMTFPLDDFGGTTILHLHLWWIFGCVWKLGGTPPIPMDYQLEPHFPYHLMAIDLYIVCGTCCNYTILYTIFRQTHEWWYSILQYTEYTWVYCNQAAGTLGKKRGQWRIFLPAMGWYFEIASTAAAAESQLCTFHFEHPGLEASVLHLEKLPGLMLRDYAASCLQGIRKKSVLWVQLDKIEPAKTSDTILKQHHQQKKWQFLINHPIFLQKGRDIIFIVLYA